MILNSNLLIQSDRRAAVKKSIAMGAAIAVFGFVNSAIAADMPAKAPVYKAPAVVAVTNWNGFYIGGHVGAGSSSGDLQADYLPFPAFGLNPTMTSLSKSGLLGGIQAGYNWMFAPRWLIGAEADYTWTGINASKSAIPANLAGVPVPAQPTSWTRNLKWLASARARLGYTVAPDVLVYATGGAAWGGSSYNSNFVNGAPGSNEWMGPFSKTSSGYVIGGGAEWMFASHWLLRGEYLFYHLQGVSNLVNNPVFPVNPILFTWNSTNTHVGRIAVSYKFD
jgi:outer membrane immunogenic protein